MLRVFKRFSPGDKGSLVRCWPDYRRAPSAPHACSGFRRERMKIYTKTGDLGDTGLFGGPRVRKDDLRIEAYGTVDELNAVLGLARSAISGTLTQREQEKAQRLREIEMLLTGIQHTLF